MAMTKQVYYTSMIVNTSNAYPFECDFCLSLPTVRCVSLTGVFFTFVISYDIVFSVCITTVHPRDLININPLAAKRD